MYRRALLFLLVIGLSFSIDINNCTTQVTLNESNSVYNVVADLNYTVATAGTACLWINATNVTLDCQGRMITGTQSNLVGAVFVGSQEHAMVINCHANNFTRPFTVYNSNHTILKFNSAHNSSPASPLSAAFWFEGDLNTTVDSNLAYNTTTYGFGFWSGSRGSTVTNNDATLSALAGFGVNSNWSAFSDNNGQDNTVDFYIVSSHWNNFSSNTANNTILISIWMERSNNNIFEENNLLKPQPVSFQVWMNSSNNNTFSKNNLTSEVATVYSVYLLNSTNNTIISNNIINTKGILAIYAGISPRNNISENNITLGAGLIGIWFDSSHYNYVYGNEVSGGSDGFQIVGSDLGTFLKNYVHGMSNAGFYLFSSDRNNISENKAYDCGVDGFFLDSVSENNTISGNSAYNNSENGFRVSGSTRNTFQGNLAFNNSQYGIRIDKGCDYHNLSDNAAYNNSFYGFLVSSDYNNLVNNSAYENTQYGFYLSGASVFNNVTNNSAYNNSDTGFYLVGFHHGLFSGNRVYGNTFNGFHLVNSENHTFSGSVAFANGEYGVYLASSAVRNVFTNTLIYNQTHYLFQQPTAATNNNFTNLTTGYNSSIGLISFGFMGVNDLYLNYSNLLLDPYFVSLNDSDAKQANVSANITLGSTFPYPVVYRGGGFPATRAEILSGSIYPASLSCAGTACTFNVSGFSGYTLGDPGCLNLSDDKTWAGRVVKDSGTGILYVNQNTTLCRDYYIADASGTNSLLSINSSNIFLDCNESIIDGVDGTGTGIYVAQMENASVYNCVVANYSTGFFVGGQTLNTLFANDTALNNSVRGFYLEGARFATIANSSAVLNANMGVGVVSSNDTRLENVSAHKSNFGFFMNFAQRAVLLDVLANGSASDGFRIWSSNYILIEDAASFDNVGDGFEALTSNNLSFTRAYAYRNDEDGFDLESVYDSNMTDSEAYGNAVHGITTNDLQRCRLSNVLSRDNVQYGLNVFSSQSNLLNNVSAKNNTHGVFLQASSNNAIANSSASNSTLSGFYLDGSTYNKFTNTLSANNTQHGFHLLNNADQNNFTTTTLSNNAGDGVYISSSNTNIFQGVTSSFNNNSFHLYQSDFNYMYNVTSVDESMHGFYLRAGSDYNRIIDGSATSEMSAGIYMTNSQSNIVRNFISNGNSYGIWLETSVLYNTITNVSGTGNAWGAYLYQASSNTFTDLLFTGSAADGFSIVTGSSSNNFTNVVSHSNAGDGFQVSGSSNSNNFTNLVSYNNSVFGLYVDTTSYYNLFYDSIIYNQSNYLYVSTPAAENNFTNLTLGYTNAIGLVNYPFLNITYVNLNTDRFLLNADWVSLNDADAAAIQANKTANITISTTNCIYVLKRTGFPTTLAEILNFGTIDVAATATLDCSTPGVAFFEVAGFSGYAVNDYTACLNLSDPGTWAGRIVNDSGILYVNKNTTLCTDHYYMNVGTDPLLEMNASNIWLNCAFSIIDGVDDSGTGIYAYQKQNFTIANCTVQNYMEGIRVREAINAMIVDDTATSNSFWGIFLHDSNSSFVQYNNVSGNQANGIMLQNSHYNNIRYNNVSSNGAWRGIGLLSSSSYNNVSHNNVSGQTSYAGIEVDNSNSNLVSYNDIHSNYNGIYGANSDSNTFSRNEMHDNFASGLELSYSDYLAIENNTASGNSDSGLSLNYVSYSNISGNDAHGNGNHGILLGYSPSVSNLISGNNASGNGYHGIYLYFASGNSVINNEVSNSADDGINVQNSQDNIVSGNMVYGNLADGIQLYGDNSGPSRNNTLANNTLYGNDVCGIYLEQSHHNTLENNTAYGNYIGLFIYYSNNSVFSNSTIYGSDDQGIRFWESSGNNLTDTFTYSNGNWALMVMSNSINRFTNTLIYDQTPYMYIVSSSPTNFTNLTLGYNSTVGLVNYPSMNTTTNTMPYEGTNVHLQQDWVSITPSGLDIGQAASPAFITINNSACGTIGVLRETGFPTSLASILTNGLHYPTSVTCNGELATFYVDGFSGYTLGQEATTLDFNINESSPITYGTSINITCNASNTEVLVEIFQNGTSIAGPLAGYVDYAGVFAAGLYNFSCNTSGNENYTAAEASEPFQINKASPAVTFVSDLGWSIRPGQTVNISCNTSNPEITIELWNSTEMIGSGQYAEHVWTPPAGSYEYTCNSTETENYTAYSQANTLNVRRPSSGGDGRECSLQIFAPESASTSEEVRVGVMRMDGSTEGPMLYNARLVFTHIDSRPGSARPTSEYSTNTDGYSPGILFTLAGRWEIIAEFGDCEPATVIMNIYESDVYNIGLETSCDGNVITVTREVCEVLESPEPGMGEMGCRQVPVEGAEVRVYRCQEDWETAGDPLNTCSELVDTLTTDKAGKAVTYHRDMDVRIVADLRVASHFVGTTIFGTLQDSADCPVPEEIRINFDPACEGSTVTVTGTICEGGEMMSDTSGSSSVGYLACMEAPIPGMRVEIYCCPDEFERTDRAIEDLCTRQVDSGTTDSAGMFVTNARDCRAVISVERMLDTHMEDTRLMVDLPRTEDCYECIADTDCAPGYVCRGHECIPEEDIPPEQRECTGDGDCPSGYYCSGGYCAQRPIQECVLDQECGSGFICREGECVEEQVVEGEEGVIGQFLGLLGSIVDAVVKSFVFILMLAVLLLLLWFFFWKKRRKKEEEEEPEE